MIKVSLDGIQYDAAPEVVRALEKAQNDLTENKKSAQASLDAATAKFDATQAQLDSATAEITKLKAATSNDVIQKRVRERASLETNARRFLAKDVQLDGLTDAEIKKQVVKAINKDTALDGKSDAYLDAAYDYVVQMNPESKKEEIPTTTVDSSKVSNSSDARKKMMEGQRDAWKKTA